MTPLRAEWTTYANLDDYFDLSLDTLLNTPNRMAVINPEWEKASEEERTNGSIDRALIRLPGCMVTLDNMPLTLNVSTGQKSKSDKKYSGHAADIADLLEKKGLKGKWAQELIEENRELGRVKADESKQSSLRGKKRGRQVSTKFNKVGTLVIGCKADGDPYIPPIILRSSKLAREHTSEEWTHSTIASWIPETSLPSWALLYSADSPERIT